MKSTAKLYSLTYRETKTYLFATLFVAGNLILPQLCHLAPLGGQAWLPIYFFTLIAAYKYGLRVGLLTAVLSPLANSFLFQMPALELQVLSVILMKSTLLAVAASYAARKAGKVSLLAILAAVVAYQLLGAGFEWAVAGFDKAVLAIQTGIYGILFQIFVGYLVLKTIEKW